MRKSVLLFERQFLHQQNLRGDGVQGPLQVSLIRRLMKRPSYSLGAGQLWAIQATGDPGGSKPGVSVFPVKLDLSEG